MINTVLANAVPLPAATAEPPEWIMYMPAGRHTISATMGDKPKTATFDITPEVVTALNADLARRKASGPEPFFAFDHAGGRASAWPQEFAWQPDGVYARVKWSPDGAEAVTVKAEGQLPAYRYFSPAFTRDMKTNRITGLDSSEAGSLVNNPAFRSIARVAAQAVPAPAGLNEETNMKHTEIAEAVIKAGLLTPEEAAGDTAGVLASQRLTALQKDSTVKCSQATEIESWKARATQAEADLKAHRESAATAAVTEAVKAGRIPSKDTDTQEFWKGAIIEKGDVAVKALNALPSAIPGASKAHSPGVEETRPADADAKRYEAVRAKAREIQSQNNIAWGEAWSQADSLIPA